MIHYILTGRGNYNTTAGYNRVRLICKGLENNGATVGLHLLLIKGGHNKLTNFFYRFLLSYLKNCIQLISLWRKVGKHDVVVFYHEIDQYWMLRLFRHKTNLVIELTEYPFFEINEKYGKIDTFLSKRNLHYLKYASSIITCSTYLRDYYKKFVRDICIVPLVVDCDEYNSDRDRAKEIGEYVAYCGSFNNNKDGLPILIDSFKLFNAKHTQVKLVLIGSGMEKNVNAFKKQVENYGLKDKVIFTGSLSHKDVGAWLSGALMLALARPNNRQAEGGVPSKVGEYLASGVPSVITRTGDLPKYLHDGKDCFLCEPDSVDAFAQRMEDCYLSDREMVGNMAKDAAKQFDCLVQAKELLKFFQFRYKLNIGAN